MNELVQWKESTFAMLTQKEAVNLGQSFALLDELVSAHDDGISIGDGFMLFFDEVDKRDLGFIIFEAVKDYFLRKLNEEKEYDLRAINSLKRIRI